MEDLYSEFAFLEREEDDNTWYGDNLYGWCKENGERGQRLIEEWDEFSLLLGEKDDMRSYAKMTDRKVQWKCSECGEPFKMAISCRTFQGQNCPKCGVKKRAEARSRQAVEKNNLIKWCEENGEYGQHLIREWDCENNQEEFGRGMGDFSAGSQEKANWICSRCKEPFRVAIAHRTICKSGCPNCRIGGTSYAELFIYHALKQLYDDTEHRAKKFGNVEFDITIPSRDFYIEYNGSYWHKNKAERDREKRKLCEENGIHLLQIIDDRKSDHDEFGEYEIHYKNSVSRQDQQLREIAEYIVGLLGGDAGKIDFDRVIERAGNMAFHMVECSVADEFPDLMKEWKPELNHGLEPECFTSGSRRRIVWQCFHCWNKWDNTICSRTRFQSGCPKCGYNVFDNKMHRKGGNKPRNIIYFGAYNL